MFFSGCIFIISSLTSPSVQGNSYILPNSKSQFIDIIEDIYPEINTVYAVNESTTRDFKNGENIGVYHTQGIPLSKSNADYSFFPHFTKTVVIVVDRSLTDENIESFSDLVSTKLKINFDFGASVADKQWEYPSTHHIVIAMADAIYGSYDIEAIAEDFGKIADESRFFTDDMLKPVIVTTDDVAVQMIKSGRDLEIIIPKDGTHSIDFGALVYDESIVFDSSLQNALIASGYRLPDGNCDLDYYPSFEEYSRANYIEDIVAYNQASSQVSKTLRRDAFNTRLFGFANTIETAVFYLLVLFIIICYLVSISRRITDRRIRDYLAACLVLIMYLITAGLFKSLNGMNAFLETFLWYSYYIPILLMPALFVRVAILIDNYEIDKKVEKAYSVYFKLTFIPIVMVFTNSFHNLVFVVKNYYTSSFTHNIGYYFVMGWVALSVIFAYSLLVYKSITSPKKGAFVYPAIVSVIIAVYVIGRALRFTAFIEFDTTFAISIMVLIYIESCMQSRLFPINKGYSKFFNHSNLAMEIKDNYGNTAYKSRVIKDIDENFVKRSIGIVGGEFYYFEDYTALNNAEKKLVMVNEEIKANNEFLLQNNKVKADLAALSAEKSVYDSIDNILVNGAEKIEGFISGMDKVNNKKRLINVISIYALLMKRECMYRINAMYQHSQSLSILLNSFAELKEFTDNIGLSIAIGCRIQDRLSTSDMSSIYSFFAMALKSAIDLNCSSVLIQIYKQEGKVIFSVIADKALFSDSSFNELSSKKQSYQLFSKDWEDTKAYLLSLDNEDSEE